MFLDKNSDRIWGKDMSKASEKNLSLEENFEKLEETIALLESEDISLEEAFQAYSQGMTLLKSCNEQIDRVEKKVLVLGENGEMQESNLEQ